jgi:hypothetical protein
MEMKLRSYPKVYNMGHSAIKDLFLDEVVIEEKIDGSQFSFGVRNGQLFCRSQNKEQFPEQIDKMFKLAVEQVQAMRDELQEGWTYRGEYLYKPKHNTLCYSRVPYNNIIIFDIDMGEENYCCLGSKWDYAGCLGFETVPLLFKGKVSGYDEFVKFLESDSILGGTKIEGVVVKNYHRYGRDGKVLMGKFVSEAFKEKHQRDWKVRNPAQTDVIELISSSLRTEARWNKAIQHLKERGEFTGEVKDIGPLMDEICKDIEAEEQEYIKEKLYQWAKRAILRKCAAGFPEWFKDKLLKEQFDSEQG